MKHTQQDLDHSVRLEDLYAQRANTDNPVTQSVLTDIINYRVNQQEQDNAKNNE
jgi:hypothetical protein